MEFLKVVFLFLFFKCAICESEKESLVKPCDIQDMECLRKSTQMFLEKTSAGIPEHDIKPIEPVFLPMVCVEGGKNVMLHYKNVSILGLKNLNIADFKLDPTAKSVVLSTKQDLDITADIVVEFTDKAKTLQGTWTAKASTVCNVNYNYNINKDDKGVEHFIIGPETINCETPEVPKVTLNEDLEHTLASDPDAISRREQYAAHLSEKRKETVSKMTNEAFVSVIHNIRAAAKLLPKSSFLNNV